MNSNQQQGNRLQLNFGFGGGGGRGNDQYNQDSSGRAFPTTPSTFPQPVYPNQAGQQEVWGTQQQGNGYSGYFMGGNTYQQQPQYQGQQGNLQAPNQARFNEAANGLVHQLSHQHLGGGGRSGSPYGRQPSPGGQRPRTAGDRGQQQYSSYSQGPRQPSLWDEEPPAKAADKYPANLFQQSKVSATLVNHFFKDSVQRARDRNQR
jgi:protein-serine/threonine kinase